MLILARLSLGAKLGEPYATVPSMAGSKRRTAHRPEPAALADRARSRPRYLPGRGWPGPGPTAPAASHEAGHRPLVPVVLKDRPRTHPLPARPAHRSPLPVRPSPAGLVDPLAAAGP